MFHEIEESILIDAPPGVIFRIWGDVTNWKRWDADTKESWLDGPLAVGANGHIVPAKGRGVPMQVTECALDKSFTVQARVPLFCMTFEHELAPHAEGTLVTHRVSFSGALNFLLGRIVGAQVRRGLPLAMASLKRYAEERSAAAAGKTAA